MLVRQICIGRFHHFHMARQLERHSLLESLHTGYPKVKLKDEKGVPKHKIKSFPWVQTPYMLSCRFKSPLTVKLQREMAWWAHETLDRHVASMIRSPVTLIALSGSGLLAGKAAKEYGGFHICDRGSTHISYQQQLLTEEYASYGLKFSQIDQRMIEKEKAEYEQSDQIFVPSEFVMQSFIAQGVPRQKLLKIPYGMNTSRFTKIADVPEKKFRVLWVGNVSIRKGFKYLFDAFVKLKVANKELVVIGNLTKEIKSFLSYRRFDNVRFLGLVPNRSLVEWYSSSHAFVLPSIEEGLAMVQGEALACGCPVISTPNSGAEDLFSNGIEGFIIPIRSSESIHERLMQLADDHHLRQSMSNAAIALAGRIGGWNQYGDKLVKALAELKK